MTTEAWSGAPVDPEVAAAAMLTARMLEDRGHVVVEASPAVDWEAVSLLQVPAQVAQAMPWDERSPVPNKA